MNKHSRFDKIVEAVTSRSVFQKKKLEQYLASVDGEYYSYAEEFAKDYGGYLDSQGIPIDYAIVAYLDMCKSMMKCQLAFMHTGVYPATDQNQAFAEIYASQERMKSYMIALALSQFLWPTHYRIYIAFINSIRKHAGGISHYLEIGPGHGLYMHQAMQYLGSECTIHAVDISPVSVEITQSIIGHFHPARRNTFFWTGDILDYHTPFQYEFITMGEVLEHVSEPFSLLCKLAMLLTDSGRTFVTTSINSPAVDHIYHFKSVDEVREMFFAAGLKIINEEVLPVENLPFEEIVARKITINYFAELQRISAHE